MLDPKKTVLVLIDLQKGIVSLPLQPRSGEAVVAAGKALAARFRAVGAPVILVNVDFGTGGALRPNQSVDQAMNVPQGGPPPEWSQLVGGVEQDGDIRITKRQWGAFYGTDLDLQLRRRGIETIVLGGIATNFGVESTARQAWEHGYAIQLAEDACAGPSESLHNMTIEGVFPRISRVVQSADIVFKAQD
jgi:nicotinamidase-related amidase